MQSKFIVLIIAHIVRHEAAKRNKIFKMVTVHKVSGYDEFVSFISNLVEKNPKSQINVYFTGSKLASGKSWCPDCNDGMQNATR